MNKMLAMSVVLPLALSLGCDSSGGGSAPGTSAQPGSSAAPAKAPEAKPAPTAEAKPASAAASFPATALPSKDLADFTIGLPTGGKLEASGDRSTLEAADYRLIVKVDPKADLAGLKDMLGKMKTFKSLVVDEKDGLVAQFDEKDGTQFIVQRNIKVGDKTLSCESAMTKPAKTIEKAKEAYDVCGTIKKK